MMNIRAVCAACAAAASAVASAQEARFLEPASAVVSVGDNIRLSVGAAAGEGWPAERIEHFFARSAWGQENRETLEASGEHGATWRAEEPGVLLLGFELGERDETVSAASFRAFLRESLPASRREGLGATQAVGEVTVRRVESAKALVRVESAGAEPVSIATSKTGQAVEIRPLFDPTALTAGADLPVKIYSSVPGPDQGTVLATNTTTGEEISAETGEDATAVLTLPSAGSWRVAFHAVMPIEEEEASWLIHTATLTFDVAGGAQAGEGVER